MLDCSFQLFIFQIWDNGKWIWFENLFLPVILGRGGPEIIYVRPWNIAKLNE